MGIFLKDDEAIISINTYLGYDNDHCRWCGKKIIDNGKNSTRFSSRAFIYGLRKPLESYEWNQDYYQCSFHKKNFSKNRFIQVDKKQNHQLYS